MNKNETFESIYVKNMNNLDLKVNSSKNILYKDAPLHITGGTIIEKDLYLGGSLQIGNKIITPKSGETQYEGMIYYDSTEKTLKLFSNDAFRTIVTNDRLDVELEENDLLMEHAGGRHRHNNIKAGQLRARTQMQERFPRSAARASSRPCP